VALTALLSFGAAGTTDFLSFRRTQRAQRADKLQDARKAAYAQFLVLATELGGELDMRTPEPTKLGEIKSNQVLLSDLKAANSPIPPGVEAGAKLGLPEGGPELLALLANVYATSMSVRLLGDDAVARAATELHRNQRGWILSLQNGDTQGAQRGFAETKPAIREFMRAARQELGVPGMISDEALML
jgi:hypothetical protein